MTTMDFSIVTVDGEEHRVTVVWSNEHETWCDTEGRCSDGDPRRAAVLAALRRDLAVAEVVGPGEKTRAEVLAVAREAWSNDAALQEAYARKA